MSDDHLKGIERELDIALLRRRLVDHLGRECKYPMTLYSAEATYRVTFSPEEHAVLRMEGWTDQKTPGKEYRVWTAVANGQDGSPAVIDSTFWRTLREEFEALEPGEYSLIWNTRPPVSMTGIVLSSLWSWWRSPNETQRARFSAIALKGAKALGHSSEDGWLDELRRADFVHFELTGSSQEKQPDGTMVDSKFGAIEDVRNLSITHCHALEATARPIQSSSLDTQSSSNLPEGSTPELLPKPDDFVLEPKAAQLIRLASRDGTKELTYQVGHDESTPIGTLLVENCDPKNIKAQRRAAWMDGQHPGWSLVQWRDHAKAAGTTLAYETLKKYREGVTTSRTRSVRADLAKVEAVAFSTVPE